MNITILFRCTFSGRSLCPKCIRYGILYWCNLNFEVVVVEGGGGDSMCNNDFKLMGDLYNVSSFYLPDYITMGLKNKKSRSKFGNPGGSGRPAGEFSGLDEQEKRDYFNDAVHKHRYGTDISTVDSDLLSLSSSESEDESSSVARPPLLSNVT